MSHAHANLYWPGIGGVTTWAFPFGPGIKPSTCTVTLPANTASPEARGDLVLEWVRPGGASVTLRFPDCVIEHPPVSASASGTTARLPIKDRRHWWQFGAISGSYNVKRPDGTFLREKTPVELATILLKEMGEQGYDVSKLPKHPRPEVKWDYSNPAAELDRLCQSFGCIVVLNPRTNKVEIWPEGEGDDLPDLPTVGESTGFSLLAAPEEIKIVGKPTVFESMFYCGEQVGEDTDGTLKKMEDVSYAPPNGWGDAADDAYDIEGSYVKDGQRLQKSELARKWLFKAYRFTGLVSGTGWCPELLKGKDNAPKTFDDIRLLDHRISHAKDTDQVARRHPAQVYVCSWQGGEEPEPSEIPKLVTTGFTIDANRGLIIFSEPQYRIVNGQNLPARVWVLTGFLAGKDGVFEHYERSRKVPGGKKDSGARIEKRDLTREVSELWRVPEVTKPAQGVLVRKTDNQDKLHTDADAQIDAILKGYELQTSPTKTYPGIVYVSPNGRIQQVTWQSGPNGSTTQASAGSRHNPYVPTLEDQRRERDARELDQMLRAGVINQQVEQVKEAIKQ